MHHRQKLSITPELRWFALVAAIVLQMPICHAQTDEYGSPIPIPQSPNAASFGEYGKIGVNGYQGTANICIPLFDLELCGKKFPVTLSYNSSGIKVAQEASWVGLGWNLNIGGCITRQVMGGDDFYRESQKDPYTIQQMTDYSVHELVEKGYSYSSQYLLTQGWQVPFPNILGYDTQPDEFYFNFGGHCGAFFFEPKSQKGQQTIKPVIVNQEEWLDITFLLEKDAFVVKDIDGFFYYFGTKEYTTSKSYISTGVDGSVGSLTRPNTSSIAYSFDENHSNVSAWMLDSIVAPNGEVIQFLYAQEVILTPIQTAETDQVRFDPTYESFSNKHNYVATYYNARIDQQRLVGISTPTMSVDFSTSLRKDLNSTDNSNKPRACNNISVKNDRRQTLKSFGFFQSYFGNTNAFSTCRLKLDSVIIGQRAKIGQQAAGDYQIYNFTYVNGDFLPAKNSRQRDLWGFYNKSTAPDYWGGADSKQEGTNLPSMKVKSQNTYRTIFYGRNKKCNASSMQYGILTDITYPTGGKTHFIYEPHSFDPMRTEIKEVKLVNNGYASVNYFSKRFAPTIDSIGAQVSSTITLTDTSEVLFDISYEMYYQIDVAINANLIIQKKNNTTGYYANVYKHSVMTSTSVQTDGDRQTVLLPPGTYKIYWGCINDIYAPYDNHGQQPTGNYLNFSAKISYNTSTKDSEIIAQGGGLRIKEQYDIDTNGTKYNHRKYTYESGLHYVYPTFEFGPFYIDYLHSTGYSSCSDVYAFLYHGYSSEPLIALTPPFCSSPVGYGKVTEEFVGNGSVEYYYQNQRAVFFEDPLLYDSETQVPGSKCSLLHALGTLQKTCCYNNEDQIISETTFNYSDTKNSSAQAIVSYITYSPNTAIPKCPNSHSFSPNIIFKKYKLDGFTHLLTSKTEKEFFNGKSVSRTTSYTYDDYLRPTEVTTTASNGSIKAVQTKYLKNTNQLSLITKQTCLTDGVEDVSKITNYKYLKGGAFRVPSDTYRTENGMISNYIRFTKYNDVGDPLTIQLEEGMLLEYAWDKHRLTEFTQSGMLHYAFEHHPLFGLTKRVEPTERTLEFSYNAIGQLYRTQENGKTLCTYDYKLRKGGDNVVTTQNWLSENGAQTMTAQQFYNGLGYPSRNVGIGITPGGFNLTTETAYDDMMRPVIQYLPQINDYPTYSDPRPFAETFYEASPLDRPVASVKPGEAYAAHPATTSYETNSMDEVRLIRFAAEGVSCDGFYAPGSLYKEILTDEDGRKTSVFNDFDGNTVLQRRFLDGRDIDTYYVYDHLGRLRCVLPPLAASALTEGQNRYDAELMKQYAYVYTYDSRSDLVEKRLPGCEPVRMSYDNAHRLIRSTDGGGNTIQYEYDAVGRLVRTLSGGCTLTEDTYTGALLTRQKVAVLDSANLFVERSFSYDGRDRLVSTTQTNLLGGYDTDSTVYSYSSQPLELWHTHVGKDSVSWHYRFVYDHADRPVSVYYTLGGHDEILLTQNTYNELCQLSGKTLYDGLIQQSFAYNLQGACNSFSGKDYKERLFFEDAPEGAMPSFAGDLSAKRDSSLLGSNLQRFSYDGLDRLIAATSDQFGTSYTYDDMANILSLTRSFDGVTTDSLVVDYEGHQVQAVNDLVGSQNNYNTVEYQDRHNGQSHFYDANGNLIADYDRNILRIEYNLLNLPSEIVFMDSSRIHNTYLADGTKVRTVYRTNAATLLLPIGHLCEQGLIDYLERTVDYCGSVRYEQDGTARNTLIYNTEGYYSTADSAFYAYQKDFQGNIAQVWQVSDTAGLLNEPILVQQNGYYSDGTPLPTSQGEEVQPYRYNGNEWIRAHGYDAYDFNARQYAPALPRFDRPDPLAEKYYDVSPYAFCGGNMVRYTDPSGMKFDFSNLTEEEQEQTKMTYEAARQNSELFNKLYTALDESPTIYSVCLGGTTTVNGEPVDGHYNSKDNSITFLDVNSATSPTVYIEEMFHAYQKGENIGLYSNEEFNFEFEAKVAKYYIETQLEENTSYIPIYVNDPGLVNIMQDYDFNVPSSHTIRSNKYIQDYYKYSNEYANFCKTNNIGNINYKKTTRQLPSSLLKLYE